MKRRDFITKVSTSIAATSVLAVQPAVSQEAPTVPVNLTIPSNFADIRKLFPRMNKENYLNAAGGMPLSRFSEKGIQRYSEFQSLGWKHGGGSYVSQMQKEIRVLFADLIGAKEEEIGYIYNTKAGEQIVLDAVDDIKKNGNIVTNDLHFNGSLHNLAGLKKAGRDVRIVKAKDWKIDLEDMRKAIDGNTAIVCLALVSNVNGHIEHIKEITKIAQDTHQRKGGVNPNPTPSKRPEIDSNRAPKPSKPSAPPK